MKTLATLVALVWGLVFLLVAELQTTLGDFQDHCDNHKGGDSLFLGWKENGDRSNWPPMDRDGALLPITHGKGQPTFSRVQVLFQKGCFCHVERNPGHLSLKSYEDVMKGGEDGPVVKPKDPDRSLMARYVLGKEEITMPPRHRLAAVDQKLIVAWIKAGAKNDR